MFVVCCLNRLFCAGLVTLFRFCLCIYVICGSFGFELFDCVYCWFLLLNFWSCCFNRFLIAFNCGYFYLFYICLFGLLFDG